MYDLNTESGRKHLDRMLLRGETNEAICAAFGYPSEVAFRVAMHRAGLGIETVARKRRLVVKEAAAAEAAQ